jgi:hypothetical protein
MADDRTRDTTDEERTFQDRQEEKEEGPGRPLGPDATDPTADEPHHELNNPVDEPDPTEFPDPYERRPDPKGPERERAEHGAPSTSEPPPPHSYDEIKPEKGG